MGYRGCLRWTSGRPRSTQRPGALAAMCPLDKQVIFNTVILVFFLNQFFHLKTQMKMMLALQTRHPNLDSGEARGSVHAPGDHGEEEGEAEGDAECREEDELLLLRGTQSHRGVLLCFTRMF